MHSSKPQIGKPFRTLAPRGWLLAFSVLEITRPVCSLYTLMGNCGTVFVVRAPITLSIPCPQLMLLTLLFGTVPSAHERAISAAEGNFAKAYTAELFPIVRKTCQYAHKLIFPPQICHYS